MSPRIALDAFGGDHRPGPELAAALAAAREGLSIILVGDEAVLRSAWAELEPEADLPVRFHHAPDAIGMDESPGKAVRGKPEASMPVCFDLVRAGEADAVVSAGNSGAMLACGLFKYKREARVDRPAILTTFPTTHGQCRLLDMGANIECRPLNFVQFALMGAAYERVQTGRARPAVGVLSNGSESSKGTELTRAADRLLRAHPSEDFEYLGYVEGKELFKGRAQVIVTDGFTGNIALKTVEGTIAAYTEFLGDAIAGDEKARAARSNFDGAFAALRARLDPDQYGGAPLLGVQGVAIICHGAASPTALQNGLRLAARSVRQRLNPVIRELLENNAPLLDAAKAEAE